MQGNQVKNFLFIVVIIGIITAGLILIKSGMKSEDEPQKKVTDNSNTEDSSKVRGTNTKNPNAKDTDFILFYGDTCPHCKKVEEFITEKNIRSYLNFQNLEVYNDQENAELMMKKQEECKNLSDDDKGGVPFLYSSEKCVVGDTPVMNFLAEKAGI